MVSTRQMSTSSLSATNPGPSEDGPTISTRLSVMTRQASTSGGMVTSTPKSSMELEMSSKRKNLLDMPPEIIHMILSYIDFKKIGQLRMVSTRLNEICSQILNSTFQKLINQMFHRFQDVKAQMPRRESARRNHPLACECDIIETCHMRLSLLQMTFGKHIERKHCCFFAGGILDEVYDILRYIRNAPRLERPFQVTDELFDLSTMAMEYFKEKLEPILPEIAYFNKNFYKLPANTIKLKQNFASKVSLELSDDSSNTPPQSNMVLRKGIRKIKQGMKMYNNQLSVLRNELRTCKRKSTEQSKQIAEQQKLLAEQQKQTLEYANRLDENDKKNEEMSRKFSTLLQELNKCKTELQYWRSKSPATQTCTSCGHEVSPFVPPEVYQVLVNQGIKPEDINDTSSDNSSSALSDSGIGSEFVHPDEITTAKLLAVSTATKNLKRHHQDDVAPTHLGQANVAILSVGTSSPAPTADLNLGLRNSSAAPVAGGAAVCAAISSGCPTNLFYGKNVATTAAATFGSVGLDIMVPFPSSGTSWDMAKAPVPDELASSSSVVVAGPSGVVAAASAAVTSAGCIVSNETKKARRVQKGSRCHNVSSKRSK